MDDEIIGAVFDSDGKVSVISRDNEDGGGQEERLGEGSEWTMIRRNVGVFTSITSALKNRVDKNRNR